MHSDNTIHVINRRRHHREPMVCEVQLQAVDAPLHQADGGSHFCRSRDISDSGARLSSNLPYPINTRVLMTIECKEDGWTRITSRLASVVWTEFDPPQGRGELGIAFADLDPPKVENDWLD